MSDLFDQPPLSFAPVPVRSVSERLARTRVSSRHPGIISENPADGQPKQVQLPEALPTGPADSDGSPEVRVLCEFLFWLFAGLGTVIASAWVLVPEYHDYRAVHEQTHQVRREVARLELRNRRYQEVLDSLNDPEHLLRHLRSRSAERNSVAVQTEGDTQRSTSRTEFADAAPELRLPEPTEADIEAQQAQIPGTRPLYVELPQRWEELFRRPDRRPVLLAIAVGCLTLAFLFFAPPNQHESSPNDMQS